tara:strand:- start:11 stop:772 length:762 start_codon:yes stop_codon:yes gene_type:complete
MNPFHSQKIRTEGSKCDVDGDVACYLIHGFTGSPFEYEDLGVFLASKGISSVCDLLPGHGTTVEDCNNTKLNQWIEKVQEGYSKLTSQKKEVFVIGFSMGSALAFLLAEQNTLPGIIIYAPLYKINILKSMLISVGKYFKDYETKLKIYKNSEIKDFYGYTVYPLLGTVEAMKLVKKSSSVLNGISCPVILMHSTNDVTTPHTNSQIIYDKLGSQDKRLVSFKDSNHMLMCDVEKEEVWENTLQFIKKHSRYL